MSTQPAAASSESARVGRIVKTTAASSPSHFDLPAQVWSVVMESPANPAAPQSGGGEGAVKQYGLLFYQRQEDADAESACVQGRQEDRGITEGRRNRSLGGVRKMDKRQMGALGIGNVAGYYALVEGQAPVAQRPPPASDPDTGRARAADEDRLAAMQAVDDLQNLDCAGLETDDYPLRSRSAETEATDFVYARIARVLTNVARSREEEPPSAGQFTTHLNRVAVIEVIDRNTKEVFDTHHIHMGAAAEHFSLLKDPFLTPEGEDRHLRADLPVDPQSQSNPPLGTGAIGNIARIVRGIEGKSRVPKSDAVAERDVAAVLAACKIIDATQAAQLRELQPAEVTDKILEWTLEFHRRVVAPEVGFRRLLRRMTNSNRCGGDYPYNRPRLSIELQQERWARAGKADPFPFHQMADYPTRFIHLGLGLESLELGEEDEREAPVQPAQQVQVRLTDPGPSSRASAAASSASSARTPSARTEASQVAGPRAQPGPSSQVAAGAGFGGAPRSMQPPQVAEAGTTPLTMLPPPMQPPPAAMFGEAIAQLRAFDDDQGEAQAASSQRTAQPPLRADSWAAGSGAAGGAAPQAPSTGGGMAARLRGAKPGQKYAYVFCEAAKDDASFREFVTKSALVTMQPAIMNTVLAMEDGHKYAALCSALEDHVAASGVEVASLQTMLPAASSTGQELSDVLRTLTGRGGAGGGASPQVQPMQQQSITVRVDGTGAASLSSNLPEDDVVEGQGLGQDVYEVGHDPSQMAKLKALGDLVSSQATGENIAQAVETAGRAIQRIVRTSLPEHLDRLMVKEQYDATAVSAVQSVRALLARRQWAAVHGVNAAEPSNETKKGVRACVAGTLAKALPGCFMGDIVQAGTSIGAHSIKDPLGFLEQLPAAESCLNLAVLLMVGHLQNAFPAQAGTTMRFYVSLLMWIRTQRAQGASWAALSEWWAGLFKFIDGQRFVKVVLRQSQSLPPLDPQCISAAMAAYNIKYQATRSVELAEQAAANLAERNKSALNAQVTSAVQDAVNKRARNENPNPGKPPKERKKPGKGGGGKGGGGGKKGGGGGGDPSASGGKQAAASGKEVPALTSKTDGLSGKAVKDPTAHLKPGEQWNMGKIITSLETELGRHEGKQPCPFFHVGGGCRNSAKDCKWFH